MEAEEIQREKDRLIVELFLNHRYEEGNIQHFCINCSYGGRITPSIINTKFEPAENYKDVKYGQFLLGKWGSNQKPKILIILGTGMPCSYHGSNHLKCVDGKEVEPVWLFCEEQGFSCMCRYTTLEEIQKVYKLI